MANQNTTFWDDIVAKVSEFMGTDQAAGMSAANGTAANGAANAAMTGIEIAQAAAAQGAPGQTVTVPTPEPGQPSQVTVQAGQKVCLDLANLEGAKVELKNGSLQVTTADGKVFILANFVAASQGDDPVEVCLTGAGGAGPETVISAADLLALAGGIGDIAPAAGPGAVAPAAGGAPAHGGGSGYTPFDPGDIGDPTPPPLALPPTALGQTPPDPDPVSDPTPEELAINTPPQADPVLTPADSGDIPSALADALAEIGGGGGGGGGSPALSVFGFIDSNNVNDVDFYKFTLAADGTVYLDVDWANDIGSLSDDDTGADIQLSVFNEAGELIAFNDDNDFFESETPGVDPGSQSFGDFDSFIGGLELLAGTYYVAVSSYSNDPNAFFQEGLDFTSLSDSGDVISGATPDTTFENDDGDSTGQYFLQIRTELDDVAGTGDVEVLGSDGVMADLAEGEGTASSGVNDTLATAEDLGTLTSASPAPAVITADAADTFSVTTSDDGVALLNSILGAGITIVGEVIYIGSATSSGFFEGGLAAGIGIESGIILTSGDASSAVGPNDDGGTSTNTGTGGDADLDAIVSPFSSFDVSSLEFTFFSDGGDLFFNFVFASEEYNEFVNAGFNDVFAFFLDGENIAFIPGTDTVVSIDNVNLGSNSEFYNNNDGGSFFIEYDGFTDVFTVSIIGLSEGVHTMKIAIADTGDNVFDSAVFIQAGSFSDQPDGGDIGDIAFWKELTVDGVIGDSDDPQADFGGLDAETPLSELTFTLTSDPNYGTLILDPGDGSPATELMVGDTFTSVDTIWWVATESQVAAFLEAHPELNDDLPDATFDYSVTDADGNDAEASVVITIPDDAPTIGNPESTLVDEDGEIEGVGSLAGLPGSIPGGDGDASPAGVMDSANLDYDFGNDGQGDVSFADLDGTTVVDQDGVAVTSRGEDLTWLWDGGTHTLTALNESEEPVLTLEVTDVASGDYKVTLLDVLDHPDTGDTNDEFDDIILDLRFTVTDTDGDFAEGSVQVTIDDDGPMVSNKDAGMLSESDIGEGGGGGGGLGDIDIFVGVSGFAEVLTNDGTGIFTNETSVLGQTLNVALGDLDGDGDLDAFLVLDPQIAMNDGNGVFTTTQFIGNGPTGTPNGVALGDVDGDGDLDAVMGGSGNNSVWLNDGTGTFSDSGQVLESGGFTIFTFDVALGDFDNDGDLDIFYANSVGDTVWINQGGLQAGIEGEFINSGQILGTFISVDVALGDIDNDGDLDAIIATGNSRGQVWVNDGSGNFTLNETLFPGNVTGVQLGDLDGDGDLDAVFSAQGTGTSSVWLNQGGDQAGTLGDFDLFQTLGVPNSAQDVALADVDDDGDLDIIFVSGTGGDGEVEIWLNNGDGSFTEGQTLAVGGAGSVTSVAVGDLDGDGDGGGGGTNVVAAGTLNFDFGADEEGAAISALAFVNATDPDDGDAVLALESGGQTVVFGATTIDGDDIVLTGTIDGGGTDVIELRVDQTTGDYTITLFEAIDHPDINETGADDPLILTFTYTATDGDGDSATAEITVNIKDDGPTAVIEVVSDAAIVLDETIGGADTPDDDIDGGNPDPFSGLGYGTPIGAVAGVDLVNDTTSFGTDGPGTRTVALIIASIGIFSGLNATGLGAINLYVEANGDVTGRVDTSDGQVAFAISVDQDGNVTVAQYLAIDHGDDGNEHDAVLSINATALSVEVSVTDADGDTDTDSVNIGGLISFEDDGPIAGTAQTLILSNDENNSGIGDLNFTIGSDQPASYTLTMAMGSDGNQTVLVEGAGVWGLIEGVPTQMSSDGTSLVWHMNVGSPDQLLYPDGSWSAVLGGSGADTQALFEDVTVYTVVVNDDGTYKVFLDNPLLLDGGAEPFVLNFTQAVQPGNDDLLVIYDSTADDLDPVDGIPDGSTIMALAVGTSQDGSAGTVNTSSPGMGVDNNFISASGTTTETLDLFFSNPVDITSVFGPGNLDPLLLDFITITLNHLTTTEFALVSVHVDGVGEVWFKVVGIGGPSSETVFTIEQGTTGDGSLGGDGTTSDTAYVVDMSGGTGTVFVDGEFDHLHFQADDESSTGYRMLSAEGQGGSFGFDIDTTFTAEAEDGDGDTVTTEFNVIFDSGPELDGTTGDDVIVGNGSDEIITGFEGNDILSGDGGADTFVFLSGDVGNGSDLILDFSIGDGDVIDISDVFAGTGGEDLSIADLVSGGYLELLVKDASVGTGADDTVISVDTAGGSSFITLLTVQDVTLLMTDTSSIDNIV